MRWFTRRFRADASNDETHRALRAVLRELVEGDYEVAERRLVALLRADSGDVQLYLALAHLYRGRGEVGRAIRIHQNVLLRRGLEDSVRTAALAALAADYQQGGFAGQAIKVFEEVLGFDSRHRPALRALHDLRAGEGDYPGAIEAAGRLARLEGRKFAGEEAGLLLEMARAAQAEGRNEQARKAVKRALRKDPRRADGYFLLGELEAERGRNRAALAAWKKVPALLGENASREIFSRLEAAFASLGRGREYEDFLRKLMEGSEQVGAVRVALALELAARGALDQAVIELRRLMDVEPKNLEARIALGRLLLSDHRNHDALKEFAELLEVLDEREQAQDSKGSV